MIYLIENTKNGKQYVGYTSKTLEERWKKHCGDNTTYFHKAIRKHGKENFVMSILDEDGDFECEKYWIEKLNTFVDGYNLTKGGESGMFGRKHTEKARRKLSEFNRGRKHTDETKRKIGEAHKDKTLSEETKRKMSEAKMGDKNPNYGKTPSKEARRKMSESRTGEKNWRYGKKTERFPCNHCGKRMSKPMLGRWHNDNCKEKRTG